MSGSLSIPTLALGLSHAGCAIALQDASGAVFSEFLQGTQSTTLATAFFPLIDTLCHQAGVSFREIERIAVTRGPSSFTGIRVILSVVQGMVLARPLSCISPTNFELLAFAAQQEGIRNFLVLVDNQKGGGYGAIAKETESLATGFILSLEEVSVFMKDHGLQHIVTDLPQEFFEKEEEEKILRISPQNLSSLLLAYCERSENLAKSPLMTPFYGQTPQYVKKKVTPLPKS